MLGGFGLVCAFFMPWFSTQGLLLSGQFLGNPGDLRRFLPGSSGNPAEAQLLRALVDLFPAGGLLAMVATLAGGLRTGLRWPANVLLALSGAVPLVGWAVGISRLPVGAGLETGLWLIALSSGAILLGLGLAVMSERRAVAPAPAPRQQP